MQESWSTRWYMPLVVLGAGLVMVLGIALAGLALFTAGGSRSGDRAPVLRLATAFAEPAARWRHAPRSAELSDPRHPGGDLP